jgi:putative acetyltransferase
MHITIGAEIAGEQAAIRTVIEDAFRGAAHGDGAEGALVDALRRNGDLIESLVARGDAGAIVGHIGFSPIAIADGTPGWVQLAPLSVVPTCQRQGIGSALIAAGVQKMADMGMAGIALVGDPAYYARFGFTQAHDCTIGGGMDPYLQVRAIDPASRPSGKITLARAFG